MGNLYKFESHCPGPKMRNQDEGRRGQPLQDREPLPGADWSSGIKTQEIREPLQFVNRAFGAMVFVDMGYSAYIENTINVCDMYL